MSTKTVKGLLKGLRYISKVFDDEQDEPDMQIGYPTDVKHVAHIGWDGPENNSGPTWMNDFKPNPEDDSSPRTSSHRGKMDTSKMSVAIPPRDGSSSPVSSPSRRATDGTKKSRNRRHTPNSSVDSPTKRDTSASGGHRSSRRAQGTDPNSQDSNSSGVTKKVRRRRKVLSEGGSTKSTKSKEKDSSMDGADPELAGSEFGSQG
uniref:CRIB domain-containing protein n=1 Tax=Kalanchoe fedtschenkoi TaxID=63787 RepID=A0A7N0TLC2_KALFE